ncbi:terpenoid cyclases/protein prenyltransferase alpha-alpha toroid [Triangularia verruculosa]|uniref:Terpenoid cyclases/protein prenyltransferase alpha-alpha toroid n=1 Tax=Triangularia verruculosa TaxID=2587418 RepID=A0AAN6XJ84_9PEZI|nr:terpenoid cyclases/protein prenyltransferase alpha-alpha toroid [Triangularia verruculosa]
MAADTDTPAEPPNGPEPALDIGRHLKYWKMCLQSPLPHHYLSNEGNRMALAYFIINSIVILTPNSNDTNTENPLITPQDRRKLRQWVLSHQHPGGGFSPSSSLVFPLQGYEQWEPETGSQATEPAGMANAPGTLFALQLLALLADEDDPEGAFDGVDRVQTLRWLRRLQREDGSFGEVLRLLPGQGWFIGGGYDMRYCYIAASIRWMLRGKVKEGEPGWVEDIDTERLANYILSSQTYDGGFAGSSQEEPHAGYAYCAISALSLLDRPLETTTHPPAPPPLLSRIRDVQAITHWLTSRQFVYLDPPSPEPSPEPSPDSDEEDPVNFLLPSLSALSLSPPDPILIASNGRTNKVADTCYTWWVLAALSNLSQLPLFGDWSPARMFLLEKMTHRIGGFSKYPGGPPDVYHSCFGLTVMSLMGEPGLRKLDGGLAVPEETVAVIEKARGELLRRAKIDDKAREVVELGVKMRGTRPAWLKGVN